MHDRLRSSSVADLNANTAASGSGAPPVSFPKRLALRARSASRTRFATAAVKDSKRGKVDQQPESQDPAIASSSRQSPEADRGERQERGRTNRNDAQRGSRTDNASPVLDSSSRLRTRNPSQEPGASPDEYDGSGVFKRMTTHFRRRVSGALPQHTTGHNRQNSAPPLPNSFTNKDLREKALRERGLLPALPRDLSAQEAARDQQKTHVKSLSDDEAGRGKKTAAMLIREEYEAKERQLANQESSDSSRSVSASTDSATSRMVLISAAHTTGKYQDQPSQTLVGTSRSEDNSERLILSPTSPSTPTQLSSFPSSILPNTSGSFAERFARMPPAPSRKPPPPPIHTALTSGTPTNSTPKALPALPSPDLNVPLTPSPTRPALNKSNSTSTRHTSSSEVPSLSHSTSDAPSASSSLPSPTSPTQPKDVEIRGMRPRPSNSHVYRPIDGAIPTISQEASFSPFKRIAEIERRAGYDEHGVLSGRRGRPDERKTLPNLPASSRSSSMTPSESSERRKPFSLFGKKSSASSDSEGPSLKSSFTNLRRAFNGAEKHKRPKTEYNPPPSSFGGAHRKAVARPHSDYVDEANSRRPGVGLRAPLNPTMHNRGSIMTEMRGIENDESRRLSEIAFLE